MTRLTEEIRCSLTDLFVANDSQLINWSDDIVEARNQEIQEDPDGSWGYVSDLFILALSWFGETDA